jgi:hypothetical protein
MAYKRDEIKQVLREERSRGKTPPLSQEEIQRQLKQFRIIEKLLRERNISQFIMALNDIGLHRGSKDYDDALDAWHEHWSRRHR